MSDLAEVVLTALALVLVLLLFVSAQIVRLTRRVEQLEDFETSRCPHLHLMELRYGGYRHHVGDDCCKSGCPRVRVDRVVVR